MFSTHIDHEKNEWCQNSSLDFYKLRNSGINGIAGICTWITNFCLRKVVLYMFSIHIDHEENESEVKTSVWSFRNSVIQEFVELQEYGQELCSIHFCSAKIKNAVLNFIYLLVMFDIDILNLNNLLCLIKCWIIVKSFYKWEFEVPEILEDIYIGININVYEFVKSCFRIPLPVETQDSLYMLLFKLFACS